MKGIRERENYMQIIIILIGIGLFFGYKGVKKYFKWIESTTNYKPINKISITLIVFMFVLPILNIYRRDAEAISFMEVILFIIPLVILVYCNRKVKNYIHIISVTILQVVFSVALFLVAAMLFVASLAFGGGTSGGNKSNTTKNNVDTYDYRMAQIKQSWVGHETDYDRAVSLGYNTPEEAMEAGYMHDGSQIYKTYVS